MDEMTTVRTFRAQAPTPDRADLVGGRDRLLAATAAGGAPPRIRLVRRAVVSGAVAAVAAAAFTVVQVTGDTSGGAGAQLGNAAAVLENAADTIEDAPRGEPRPDQWVYSKTVYGKTLPRYAKMQPSEGWLRYDGSKSAHRRPGESKLTVGDTDKDADERTPQEWYALLDSLPHDPDALLRTLREKSIIHPRGKTQAERDFAEIRVLLGHSAAMPVDVHAALYRALARIPGVSVTDHLVKDALGRAAVAVTFTAPEAGAMGGRMRYELLLDPTTYEQLGTRWVAAESFSSEKTDNREVKKGDALSNTADISKIVDKPGQTS
ncbi:hypothetical protein GCM10010252_74070 [Streptomyces aureoverticillatus]|nr:hypothetical protein GCM10010252_74070 [Streptomyces aureoverticillatus]